MDVDNGGSLSPKGPPLPTGVEGWTWEEAVVAAPPESFARRSRVVRDALVDLKVAVGESYLGRLTAEFQLRYKPIADKHKEHERR